MNSTICAISTAQGVGAISIIRCSGPESISIVNKIFKGDNLLEAGSHTIHYGYILDNKEVIDEVLVTIMKAPKTFTTEDIVEINSHGGPSTTNKVLEILLNNGCELAMPGEFTKRAFLNGRIDLVEAEAVGDLITSETEKARKLAISQVCGTLSEKIVNLRKKLIDLHASIEVEIDFPEYEDSYVNTNQGIKHKLKQIKEELQLLITSSENSKIIKTGINVALVGRPNVGKSSLLNVLIEEEKAIVTDMPGTTRDIVEGRILLNGVLMNIFDTAGIRATDDKVEKIGVQRSLFMIKKADLIIYVVDNSQAITRDELSFIDSFKNKNLLLFINKNDLKSNINIEGLDKYNLVLGNTINADGIFGLKQAITKLFNLNQLTNIDYTFLSNARQISLTKQANRNIINAISNLEQSVSIDLITIDILKAYELLGEIIGKTYNEDLLDTMFANFCIGK